MAQGDTETLDYCIYHVWRSGVFDFGATPDTVKVALIKSLANGGFDPATTDVDPAWGAGGTVDYSTGEIAATGAYTAGGLTCANVAVTIAAGVIHLDFDNPAAWAQNGASPTNARWAIAYSDSATNKNVIGWLDLGGDFDMTGGDLQLAWGAPFATINQA